MLFDAVSSPKPFITTWKSDNFGYSDDNQIKISTNPNFSYNYQVDWGDIIESYRHIVFLASKMADKTL